MRCWPGQIAQDGLLDEGYAPRGALAAAGTAIRAPPSMTKFKALEAAGAALGTTAGRAAGRR